MDRSSTLMMGRGGQFTHTGQYTHLPLYFKSVSIKGIEMPNWVTFEKKCSATYLGIDD